MKKTLSALLCLLFIFSFCACKNGSENTADALLVRGESSEGIYKNSFAKLTFKAPKNWSFATSTDLLANTEHAGKLLDTERLNEIFVEIGLAYDMTCYSDDGVHSVGLLFANTNHEQFKEYSSTEELLRAMIEQTGLDTSEGITKEEVTLCGESYLRLCVKTKTGTGDTGYATFYGRSEGSATVIIVAACTDDFTVSDCEACFA
ncbi:MAG: hypothetical protein E7566_01530 [Ruminococcaceae bacterium]|nr:hypothetical protein [Oscillospiraceae bacterium]